MSQKYKKRLDADRHQIAQVSDAYTGIIAAKKNKEGNPLDLSAISPNKLANNGENINDNQYQQQHQGG